MAIVGARTPGALRPYDDETWEIWAFASLRLQHAPHHPLV